MGLRFKFEILPKLKEKGYNSVRLRAEKVIGESTQTCLRHSKPVNWSTIEKLCKLLDSQPGDFLEYVNDENSEK